MHAEELPSIVGPLRSHCRRKAIVDNRPQHFVEERELAVVDARAQFVNGPAACDIDTPRHDDRTRIDAPIQPEDTAADGIVVEGGPLSDVHPTVARQDPHVRVERAETRERQRLRPQDAAPALTATNGSRAGDRRDRFRRVDRPAFADATQAPAIRALSSARRRRRRATRRATDADRSRRRPAKV